MQNFKVTVNGKVFNVSVEEGGAASAPVAAAPAAVAAPAAAAAPAVQQTTVSAGETPINAPLAGTIMTIPVKPGDVVKSGQVILTLEALKMENEIVAPADGTVKSIAVSIGTSVNVGDVLAVLA